MGVKKVPLKVPHNIIYIREGLKELFNTPKKVPLKVPHNIIYIREGLKELFNTPIFYKFFFNNLTISFIYPFIKLKNSYAGVRGRHRAHKFRHTIVALADYKSCPKQDEVRCVVRLCG